MDLRIDFAFKTFADGNPELGEQWKQYLCEQYKYCNTSSLSICLPNSSKTGHELLTIARKSRAPFPCRSKLHRPKMAAQLFTSIVGAGITH